jgi:hypothetical protein
MAAVPLDQETLPEIRFLTPQAQPTWNSEINFVDFEITNVDVLFQPQHKERHILSNQLFFPSCATDTVFNLLLKPTITVGDDANNTKHVGLFINQVIPKSRFIVIS